MKTEESRGQQVPLEGWAGPDEALGRYISEQTERTLSSYRAQPTSLEEHANQEQNTAQGGYQHRQLFELVQNSADAISPDGNTPIIDGQLPSADRGQVVVRLTEECLYCADNGDPIDDSGVKALMFSYLSPKLGTNQIGTFGLGFKAVLSVSDAPEFFSRSGSFRFDRDRSSERIRKIVPSAEHCPVLRLPEPIDPVDCWEQDDLLCELMKWAVNIVRLPLKPGVRDDLCQQIKNFPAEFLLFVEHVDSLKLIDDFNSESRKLELERADDDYLLDDGDATRQWRMFSREHRLSPNARADRRRGDARSDVPIWWAAPVDRLNKPGKFWAYFPTQTQSLVSGILNAPWKTNEDRQNLLDGPYNDELIEAAASLIADRLSLMKSTEDPACHLDVLPRRYEAGDPAHADRLRKWLFDKLAGQDIIPNQDGTLCRIQDISYPPSELTADRGMDMAPFERWAAHPNRPKGWLHHKALSRTRLATIDRLFEAADRLYSRAPRQKVDEWLEALVQSTARDEAVAASMAAVQVAAMISQDKRKDVDLGRIVLTESGGWSKPDPESLFLPLKPMADSGTNDQDSTVHVQLVQDPATLVALKELGLKPPSSESRFKAIANLVLADQRRTNPGHDLLEKFW